MHFIRCFISEKSLATVLKNLKFDTGKYVFVSITIWSEVHIVYYKFKPTAMIYNSSICHLCTIQL